MTDQTVFCSHSDARMTYMLGELLTHGIAEASDDSPADILVLSPRESILLCSENADDYRRHLKRGGVVFSYSNEEKISALLGEKCIDYSLDGNFREVNNTASAEGAIAKIIAAVPFTLKGKKILVTGFGMLGAELSRLLEPFKVRLTVAARRKESRDEIEKAGCEAADISEIGERLGEFDIIINTVPARILPEKPNNIKGKYFFELASEPYGFDADVYRLCSAVCTLCPALPTVFAPESSGRALGETIIRHIRKGQ